MESDSNSSAACDRPADCGVVLVAAGNSSRMGGSGSKLFADLAGRSVLAHILGTLAGWSRLKTLAVVVRPSERSQTQEILSQLELSHVSVGLADGGARRSDSVRSGLQYVAGSSPELVLVHDAARPLASLDLFERVAEAARVHGAVVPGVAVTDTVKRLEADRGLVTVSRKDLYAVQTPQGFRRELLEQAHARKDSDATDDAVLVEAMGHMVALVPGEAANLKITMPGDVERALKRLVPQGEENAVQRRVGLGRDQHRLEAEGPLRLGGIDLPAPFHAVGHSDGDALLHAVTDAVLGALALGDIGQHFSDQDPAHRGRDSAGMLSHALQLASQLGWRVAQVDSVVHLERPRLAEHREDMRRNLAAILGLPLDQVSIKAKTAEGLGPIGDSKLVACDAVVMMEADA